MPGALSGTAGAIAISAVALGWCGSAPTGASAQDVTWRFQVPAWDGTRWFKGNTHTHTTESDGDSPPEVVARWYREHGYDFLVLSDHNVLTDPAAFDALTDSAFILIAGEEVTSHFRDEPVHVNGLGIPRVVEPRTDSTLVGTIQANVDAVREVDGVPHVNHPNFGWAFSTAELAQVENDRLLEIHNGHPLVHNEGGGGTPGMEAVWDALLTMGKRIYGIAVDDAHHFQGEFAPDRANPGRGWVVVRAGALDGDEILENLEKGWFYASTGVVLDDVVVAPRRLEVRIAPRADFRYTTTFIGAGGRVLAETGAVPAVYELTGSDLYVRAKVVDSGGAVAWVQPVFVEAVPSRGEEPVGGR
ncbi:MAG TPA: CehA/McbA family metallohydrolase [Longimicrobiales bacterium]|nr:CehA/McbA family metallohydrolase [Longimicrobiales bacterium]